MTGWHPALDTDSDYASRFSSHKEISQWEKVQPMHGNGGAILERSGEKRED